MSIAAEARTLWRMLLGQPGSGSHAQRLQAFYAPQAEHYDRFRKGLLHGREELIERLAPPPGSVLIELGAGTGSSLTLLGNRVVGLRRFELVDLCPAMLDVARARSACLPNVSVIEADATRYRPTAQADAVFFSYALTMIPDWRAAVENVYEILKPGGRIGCVDFYVSRPDPPPGWARHRALARRFWRNWFSHAGVRLDPEHLPELARRFEPEHLAERSGPVPYLPGLRAPYYVFVGRKGSCANADPRRES